MEKISGQTQKDSEWYIKQPLVSLLMPVYNSSDFVRSGGYDLLPKTLDSLLIQNYKNFELIILDNQSTDNTSDICKAYAAKESRIKYILDSEKRFPEEAITHIAISFMHGTYCMGVSDDDLYHPDYIKNMVNFLESNPEIDMVYSNGGYIDLSGQSKSKFILQKNDTYNESSSNLSNYCVYIQKRNVIPIGFGVFRSDTYHSLLPFEKFDDLKANVDNLFIAKFFLKGYKCHFLDEELFFYRAKNRGLEVESSVIIEGLLGLDKPLLIWMYYVRHQLYFFRKLNEMIFGCKLLEKQYLYVKCITFYSFIKHSFYLLDWIKKSYIHTREDTDIYLKINKFIAKKFTPFYTNELNCGFFYDDASNNVRFQPSVIEGLLNFSLISNGNFLELLKFYRSIAGESGESFIVKELENLLQEEYLNLSEFKTALGQEIGKKPGILQKKEEIIRKNEELPILSIISPSLNLASFLEDTILSVANQSFKDFEHIVIDGGSTDGTIEILKHYPHIKWISEKDSGFEEAMRKGLAIARGKYVMSCAISDGYLDRDWFKRCVEVLDSDPEVSLVWGFPQYLTEDGMLGAISYPQFHNIMPPQKHEWLGYWLKTNFHLPEGNFCVRRDIFDKCFPAFEEFSEYRDCFLEFNYHFNSQGYLPYHISVVANFGRTHKNQLGQYFREKGMNRIFSKAYFRKVRHYRWQLLVGCVTHIYKDGSQNTLPVKFSNEKFRREYVIFRMGLVIDLAKKYHAKTFLEKLVKIKRILGRVYYSVMVKNNKNFL